MYKMGQEGVVGMLCLTSRLFLLLYRLLTSLGTSYSLHLSHLSLKLTRDPYQQTGGVEREDLGLWHYPVVTGHCPGPLLSDGDGCGLSPFRAMEEVPVRYALDYISPPGRSGFKIFYISDKDAHECASV